MDTGGHRLVHVVKRAGTVLDGVQGSDAKGLFVGAELGSTTGVVSMGSHLCAFGSRAERSLQSRGTRWEPRRVGVSHSAGCVGLDHQVDVNHGCTCGEIAS